MTVETFAGRLTRRLTDLGRQRTKDAIHAIVGDDHNIHCLTADMLDAWWASLDPEKKAELYEADLDGLLYETAALTQQPLPSASEFQAHVDRFFADMDRIQKSPLTGLRKEAPDAASL